LRKKRERIGETGNPAETTSTRVEVDVGEHGNRGRESRIEADLCEVAHIGHPVGHDSERHKLHVRGCLIYCIYYLHGFEILDMLDRDFEEVFECLSSTAHLCKVAHVGDPVGHDGERHKLHIRVCLMFIFLYMFVYKFIWN
jgi:hypothetical protein